MENYNNGENFTATENTNNTPSQQMQYSGYCRNCGAPLYNNAVACTKCGAAKNAGNNFCGNCGAKTNPAAAICTNCGASLNNAKVNADVGPVSPKSRLIALLLCIFLGGIGVHKFYLGKVGMGVLYIFTLGLFGIGTIIDLIMLAVGSAKDKDGLPVKNWNTDQL